MSYQIGIRLNEAEYQGVQASCPRYGKSAAEVIRHFVDVRLQNPPGQQPVPQPAPQPVPRPVPQPGKLPELLVERIGVLRRDRENRFAVMSRAVQQLWDLLSSVPDRYAQQCLQLPPQLAVLAVLEYVNQRRRRVGEQGMKELGMKFWNPDGYQAAQY
jgi:hypothetical protein